MSEKQFIEVIDSFRPDFYGKKEKNMGIEASCLDE